MKYFNETRLNHSNKKKKATIFPTTYENIECYKNSPIHEDIQSKAITKTEIAAIGIGTILTAILGFEFIIITLIAIIAIPILIPKIINYFDNSNEITHQIVPHKKKSKSHLKAGRNELVPPNIFYLETGTFIDHKYGYERMSRELMEKKYDDYMEYKNKFDKDTSPSEEQNISPPPQKIIFTPTGKQLIQAQLNHISKVN